MRDQRPKMPYPFPPEGLPFEPFPQTIPWDTPIHELSGWWLEIDCGCGLSLTPLRYLAAQIGWKWTLRNIVPKFRCKRCHERPRRVTFVSDGGGDIGRGGAKTKRHSLR